MYTALCTFILTLIFAINGRKQLWIFFIFLKVPLPYSKFKVLKTMFNVIYKLISFSFIFAFRINIFCLHIFIHFRINIFVYIFLYISEYIFFCFINVPLHVVQIFDEKFECSKACLTSFLPSTLHLSKYHYLCFITVF